MSSDGCQPVAWRGNAFPYLLNLSAADRDRLRDQQPSISGQDSGQIGAKPAATGVWNGPAPTGFRTSNLQQADAAAASTGTSGAASRQETSVLLPGGGRLPLVGFGTQGATEDSVRAALAAGARFVDAAAAHGNEAAVGATLEPFIASHGRDALFVASKLWNDAHRPAAAAAAAAASVAALRCGHLDLFCLHWPVAWAPGTRDADGGVALRDTWRALEALVDAGTVRYLGLANFSLVQVEEVLSWARVKPVVNIVELHPLLPQRKLTGVCLRKGVRCVASLPLAGGAAELLQHPVVLKVAASVGRTPAQVLLRWNVQRGVPVVLEPSREGAAFAEATSGLFDWALTYADKALLDGLESGFRADDPEWAVWADPEAGGAGKGRHLLPPGSTIM